MSEPLTKRELDVLCAAASGESARETAKRLWLGTQTVKFHRGNVLRKLGARNIAHAVAIAYQTGRLTLE